jgi:hypothetical protein
MMPGGATGADIYKSTGDRTVRNGSVLLNDNYAVQWGSTYISGANGSAFTATTNGTQAFQCIYTGDCNFSQGVKLATRTFATLPTCNAGAAGQLFYVTDSNSATFNANMAGGGANKVMAMCNGTNWTVH